MTRSRLAEDTHRRRVDGRPWQEYPYETKAMLGPKDKLYAVTVLSGPRQVFGCGRLVEVLIEGETASQDISVERLVEKP